MFSGKITGDYANDLTRARILSDKITEEMKNAGITKKEIENDVYKVFSEIKKDRSCNHYLLD